MGRQRKYFLCLFICSFTYILWWCWSSRQYRIREPPACRGQNGGVSPLQWSDHMAHSENDIVNNSKYSWFWFCWKKVNSKINTYWIQLLTMDRWVRSKIFFYITFSWFIHVLKNALKKNVTFIYFNSFKIKNN